MKLHKVIDHLIPQNACSEVGCFCLVCKQEDCQTLQSPGLIQKENDGQLPTFISHHKHDAIKGIKCNLTCIA